VRMGRFSVAPSGAALGSRTCDRSTRSGGSRLTPSLRCRRMGSAMTGPARSRRRVLDVGDLVDSPGCARSVLATTACACTSDRGLYVCTGAEDWLGWRAAENVDCTDSHPSTSASQDSQRLAEDCSSTRPRALAVRTLAVEVAGVIVVGRGPTPGRSGRIRPRVARADAGTPVRPFVARGPEVGADFL